MGLIWVVQGNTGEYSDHSEWPVVAFSREEDAQAATAWLNEKAREFGFKDRSTWDTDWNTRKRLEDKMREFDPDFKSDYTGTDYTYWSVELLAAFQRKP